MVWRVLIFFANVVVDLLLIIVQQGVLWKCLVHVVEPISLVDNTPHLWVRSNLRVFLEAATRCHSLVQLVVELLVEVGPEVLHRLQVRLYN